MVKESKLVKKTVWQREKETYSVSFSPVFACEWIHAGHWSCFLLARLSSWIYVNWPCLRQLLKDISLLESEGRWGCRPSWASSCVGGEGQGGSMAGYYVPQIEHSPSGSNSSVMRACWLMWTFSSCYSPVDGGVWCVSVCVRVCVCNICVCVCVCMAHCDEGEPNATLSNSSSFSKTA